MALGLLPTWLLILAPAGLVVAAAKELEVPWGSFQKGYFDVDSWGDTSFIDPFGGGRRLQGSVTMAWNTTVNNLDMAALSGDATALSNFQTAFKAVVANYGG